ncbi:MAG: hypothetical protein CMP10_18165 [Zetaproteobacteria bacterium]|nr:hypothetical protein [Pseudobdellovibrionaceae bacterium]
MKVAIVGGGICGLTLAHLLKQEGVALQVFEQSNPPLGEGAGIILAARALEVYREIGLTDKLADLGFYIKTLGLKKDTGEILSAADMTRVKARFGLSHLAIHRQQLLKALSHNLEDQIHYGHKLCHWSESDNEISLTFDNGKKHSFDYVVGTDGVNSQMLTNSFKLPPLRDSGQMCWRGVVNLGKESIDQTGGNFFEYWGTKGRFGFGPISNDSVYWFAVTRKEDEGEDWTRIFKKFADPIPEIIRKTPAKSIIKRPIIDRTPARQWSTERAVLAGDAAHSTTPNMGLGASIAIESAYILCKKVVQHGFGSEAFRSYEKERFPVTCQVNRMSYRIGQIAHIKNPILKMVRNLAMGLSPKDSTSQIIKMQTPVTPLKKR